MSDKNFMAYGDAESVLTGYANAIKSKPTIFYGTLAQWTALPAADKAKYDYTSISDDGDEVKEKVNNIVLITPSTNTGGLNIKLKNALLGLTNRQLRDVKMYIYDNYTEQPDVSYQIGCSFSVYGHESEPDAVLTQSSDLNISISDTFYSFEYDLFITFVYMPVRGFYYAYAISSSDPTPVSYDDKFKMNEFYLELVF